MCTPFSIALRAMLIAWLLCSGAQASAAQLQVSVDFTLGRADNRYYAETLNQIRIQWQASERFIKQIGEQNLIQLSSLGIDIDALRAVVSCIADLIVNHTYTKDQLVTTGVWEYNQVQVLHWLASLHKQDDFLYLLRQVYEYQITRLRELFAVHAKTLTAEGKSLQTLILRYQQQANHLITQQTLQQACGLIDIDYNNEQALQKALNAWQKLHQQQPDWPIGRYFLAKIYSHMKQVDTAHTLLAPTIDENASASYLLLYGDLLYAMNDKQQAASIWQQALAQKPAFYAVDKALVSRFQSVALPKQRLASLQKIVMRYPEDHIALFTLAQDVQTTDKSLYPQYLQQTINAKPDFLPAYDQLISWQRHNNQLENAIELAKIAINLAPQEATRLVTLGELYAQGGEVRKALFYYQQALQLDSSKKIQRLLQQRLTTKPAKQ